MGVIDQIPYRYKSRSRIWNTLLWHVKSRRREGNGSANFWVCLGLAVAAKLGLV
jgi:hypothetical protein